MVEVAEALSLEGPTEAELEGARQTLGAGRRRAPMWVDRTATELGWNETTAGAAEEWTAFHARIRAATPATVAAAGRSRLNWSAASIVVALPNRDAAEGRLDTTRTALGRHS
jgi:predicted Zn-dependent peptidase